MSIILQRLADNLFRRTGCLYAVFFLLIIALKWPFFSIPPVWDEAFSIFPSADFLVKHGFDYSLLLTQPSYHEGGPTAHALSLLTLMTALVLKITGGGILAWVVLHISQWLMAAAIGTMLTRIYTNLFDEIQAFLLAIVTLVYPLMLAQLGFMYIEIPLLFFSLFAFYNYRSDRIWLASLCLVAACLTKGSGIIAVGVLGLLTLFSKNIPVKKRILDFFILAIPSFAVVFTISIIVSNQLSFSNPHTLRDIINNIINRNLSVYRLYIYYIPELIVIVTGSVLISTFLILRRIYIKTSQEDPDIIIYNSIFIIVFSIFHFIVFAHIQTSDSHFLSRYFFYVIPSMFLVIYYSIDKVLKGTRVKLFLLLIVIGICLINRNGIFYPAIPYSSIAMAERSEEYIDGYNVQKQYISLIENKVPENIPIYVSLPDYFLTHYSVSQYVGKPLTNVYYIGDVIKSSGNKFKYPDHFVLVYNYPSLGGEYIKQIIQYIYRNKEFSFEVLGYFSRGYFNAYVFEIRRKSSFKNNSGK